MEGKLGHLEWSAKDVAIKLKEMGLSEAARKLEEHKICGEFLVMLTEDRLKAMGINLYGDILKILKFIEQITEVPLPPVDFNMFKIFNDPISGHTAIHPLCVKIIDTPQFQRLRYLKQGGACYFVFPGAANNRFEHSIGVCHLAGELARTLQTRQPDLQISDNDVLCVQIAGLCHDLGHGPFSHLFDNKFLPSVKPGITWKHEDGSVMMFDHILKTWKLQKEFGKYGLKETDIEFIKEQISNPLNRKGQDSSGRYKNKGFLYEIVSNNRNGIDVDKWDYFARDCQLLGIKNTFDHQRFMKFVRVLKVDGSLQICFKDKEAETLYGMFLIRATLQRRAYKHRVVNAIEFMIKDAFICAENKKIIPGQNGVLKSLSECIKDPVAYTQLNDSIFHLILMSTDKDADSTKARQLLERIEQRQLYRCVGETVPMKQETKKQDIDTIKKEILSYIPEKSRNLVKENDLEVDLVIIDYGHNTDNPFKTITFYNKKDVLIPGRLTGNLVSSMLPEVFSERFIRLYCKKSDAKCLDVVTESFKEWCNQKKIPLQGIPKEASEGCQTEDSVTPKKRKKEI